MILVRHAGPMRGAARSAGLSSADAADAVQEAFVRALSGWDTLRDPAALGGWLSRIARNVAIDCKRRAAKAPRPSGDAVASIPETSPAVAEVPEPGTAVAGEEREILELRYAYDMTVAEIAERLAVPVETAKKRLQRARAAALDRIRRRSHAV